MRLVPDSFPAPYRKEEIFPSPIGRPGDNANHDAKYMHRESWTLGLRAHSDHHRQPIAEGRKWKQCYSCKHC